MLGWLIEWIVNYCSLLVGNPNISSFELCDITLVVILEKNFKNDFLNHFNMIVSLVRSMVAFLKETMERR